MTFVLGMPSRLSTRANRSPSTGNARITHTGSVQLLLETYLREKASVLRPAVADHLAVTRRSTFAPGASRLFNAVDFPNRSGQKLQEGFGAEADEVHPIPDEYHEELARYAFLIASADELVP